MTSVIRLTLNSWLNIKLNFLILKSLMPCIGYLVNIVSNTERVLRTLQIFL